MKAKSRVGDNLRSGLIILAEDEYALRKLITLVLEGEGYEVISFANGHDAAVWIESNPPQFDLLITDIKIPGVSGKDLADKVCALRPDARILFISGMSEYDIADLNACANKLGPLLQKPFLPRELLAEVGKILSANTVPGRPRSVPTGGKAA